MQSGNAVDGIDVALVDFDEPEVIKTTKLTTNKPPTKLIIN